MQPKIYLLIIFLMLFQQVFSTEKREVNCRYRVKTAGVLPDVYSGYPNAGLAGAFSGIIGDQLIIAGGANYPDKKPWEGGIKQYHDELYCFRLDADSVVFEHQTFLPGAVAYGASVSTPSGILCIGGNDKEQCFSDVFLIKKNDFGEIVLQNYPELPVPLSCCSATLMDQYVYVVGGTSSVEGIDSGNYFFRLNLSKQGEDDFEWESLPPFPGKGRIFTVAVAQSNGTRNSLYLFSGRNINENKEVSVFRDGWMYDPVLEKWDAVTSLGTVDFPVMAGTAFPVGVSSIVLVGGARGDLLLQEQALRKKLKELLPLRDSVALADYKKERVAYYTEHPGFSKDILLLNTITRRLIKVGQFDSLCPVTTNIIPYKDGAIIPGGEIRPGIRTPFIFRVFPEKREYSFGWLNSLVIVIYFLVLLMIGYIFSKRQKSTDDYFKGGGRVPWWAAGLSLFGTALSAITFMAIPAKTYATDWSYFVFYMSIFLVAPIIIFLFIPFFRRLNVTTAYEYLEKRFNLLIRLIGSVSFILFQIGRMGVILLLPSLALNVVTGMDVFLCILMMGAISLVYTLMGGIEAVIWTDVIQVIVLLGGALIAVCLMLGTIDGGVETVIETAVAAHKFNLLDLQLSLQEPTLWVMLLAGVFTNITTYGTDQTMVQRYLTTRDEKEARRSAWTNAWLSVPATLLFFFIGTILFVFYHTYPELNDPTLSNHDVVFPWYIVSEMPAGLSGLLIAGIFAAAMSSLSGSINSGATAYVTDIHSRLELTSRLSELNMARMATLLMGMLGTIFALLMAAWDIHSLWDEFNKIIGLIIGSLGGLFLLGMLSRKANSTGALIGIVSSILIQIYVSCSHSVHLMLYSATGVVSCFVFGWLGSILFPKSHKNVDGLTI